MIKCRYCDMRGMLSFLILFLLSKKAMSGQEIVNEIRKRKGRKPSPGTIYPALKYLREAGLIKEKKSGKIINCAITNKGRKELIVAKREFMRAFNDILKKRRR